MRDIRLTINPKGDAEFAACAQHMSDEASDRADFERRLRERYPQAVVRARELAAERRSAFYVYRDGRWASAIGELG